MRARRFPRQRLIVTSPGILSLSPFEIVEVMLPDEGFEGYYLVEGRRYQLGSGGFTTTDTLRRLGVEPEYVTLDVRD